MQPYIMQLYRPLGFCRLLSKAPLSSGHHNAPGEFFPVFSPSLALKNALSREPHKSSTHLYPTCQKEEPDLVQHTFQISFGSWPPAGFPTYLKTTVFGSGGKIQAFPSKILRIKRVFPNYMLKEGKTVGHFLILAMMIPKVIIC